MCNFKSINVRIDPEYCSFIIYYLFTCIPFVVNQRCEKNVGSFFVKYLNRPALTSKEHKGWTKYKDVIFKKLTTLFLPAKYLQNTHETEKITTIH